MLAFMILQQNYLLYQCSRAISSVASAAELNYGGSIGIEPITNEYTKITNILNLGN